MPKLSIIVPVYKVEPYLPKCIDSILAQTFTDFELILIDDGSPDGCPRICDEYAAKDERIVVIHQENAGVSAARNAGLDAANGEYIGFVDSDDWIEPEMYEVMVASAIENDSDLVFCSWFDNSPDGSQISNRLFSDIPCVVSVDDFYRGLFSAPRTVAGSSCNKIFRKSEIRDSFSRTIRICEDNLFVAEFISRDTRISYVPGNYYHVFARPESATRKDFSKLVPSLEVRKEIISICGAVSRIGRDYAEMDYLNMAMYYYIQSGKDRKIKKQIHKYVWRHVASVLCNIAMGWKTKELMILLILGVNK